MIFLTLVMPPRLNRNTNVVVAGIYALTVIGCAVGEWSYYVFGSAVEALLLFAVVYYARTLVSAPCQADSVGGTSWVNLVQGLEGFRASSSTVRDAG